MFKYTLHLCQVLTLDSEMNFWHFGTFVLDNNPQEQLQMPIINETLDNYVTIIHGWPRSNY